MKSKWRYSMKSLKCNCHSIKAQHFTETSQIEQNTVAPVENFVANSTHGVHAEKVLFAHRAGPCGC